MQNKIRKFMEMFCIEGFPIVGTFSHSPWTGKKYGVGVHGPMHYIERLPKNGEELSDFVATAASESGLEIPAKFLEAIVYVPREHFLPKKSPKGVYSFIPAGIGKWGRGGEYCCSIAWHSLYSALTLNGNEEQEILLINPQNGYYAALLAYCTKGAVVTLNQNSDLRGLAEDNVKQSGLDFPNLHFYEHEHGFFPFHRRQFDAVISREATKDVDMPVLSSLTRDSGRAISVVVPVNYENTGERLKIFFKETYGAPYIAMMEKEVITQLVNEDILRKIYRA